MQIHDIGISDEDLRVVGNDLGVDVWNDVYAIIPPDVRNDRTNLLVFKCPLQVVCTSRRILG